MPVNNSLSKKPNSIKKYGHCKPASGKGGKGLLILVVILILILLGILAFIYILPPKASDKENIASNIDNYTVPMNVDLGASQTPQDPTANWLTYDHASTTYIFKYPTIWTLREQPQNIVLTIFSASSSEITFSVSTTSKSLTDYLAEMDKVNATSYEGQPSVQVQSSTPFASGDIKGVQRKQTLLAAGLEQDVIYLSYNNKLFTVALNSPKITAELESAFGLFLSTLKLVPAVSTSTQAVNSSSSSSTLPTSTPSVQSKTTSYSNAKFKFQLDNPSGLASAQNADGISFTSGKYKLNITGVKGAVPSLIKYQPNGAKISGSVSIAGRDAVKLLASKPANSDSPYIQYILLIDDKNWIKIEYNGKDEVAQSFEQIISSLRFVK